VADLSSDFDFPLSPAGLRAAFARERRVEAAREDGVPEALKPAAVLVPVVTRDEGLTVLLTRRTDHLHDHPGQVSFPGGRVDAGDASPAATALREAEEEIGLSRERVQLLGQLPLYRTITGFEVTPVVGLVTPPLELVLDSFEVAEAFEVPLPFLLDPRNHQRHAVEVGGRRREYWAMPYAGHYIWGATAGMIVMLARQLRRT
jgi:8-oxo-dGTP pyrophosphatase MutT (NUDIX family)